MMTWRLVVAGGAAVVGDGEGDRVGAGGGVRPGGGDAGGGGTVTEAPRPARDRAVGVAGAGPSKVAVSPVTPEVNDAVGGWLRRRRHRRRRAYCACTWAWLRALG